ncbi:MAG: hypothetical protein WC254_00040 [Candidatus Woesearchaeota archaeon]|jgi:hypothetical protein
MSLKDIVDLLLRQNQPQQDVPQAPGIIPPEKSAISILSRNCMVWDPAGKPTLEVDLNLYYELVEFGYHSYAHLGHEKELSKQIPKERIKPGNERYTLFFAYNQLCNELPHVGDIIPVESYIHAKSSSTPLELSSSEEGLCRQLGLKAIPESFEQITGLYKVVLVKPIALVVVDLYEDGNRTSTMIPSRTLIPHVYIRPVVLDHKNSPIWKF